MRGFLRIPAVLFLLFVSLNSISAERAPLQPLPEYIRIAKRLALELPREHLSQLPVEGFISARVWTNYLASLDYDRVYFLASDIAKFKSEEANLGSALKAGDISFAYRVFEVFKERIRNRCRYVNDLLDKGFDFEKDEACELTRKDAPWPKDEADWNEIWRKRIKNDYLQRIVATELSEQQPKKVTEQPGATNGVSKVKPLSPAEFMRSRYKQLLTVYEDCDSEWIMQKYFLAVTRSYDPHSDYMSPSTLEDFNIDMKLSLVGIGALLSAEDGAAKILRVIPGGPADRDKRDTRLVPGDKIVAVGQADEQPKDILHLPLQKIVKLIRGKKGTKVVLVVVPAADPTGSTTKIVDLERDEVKLEESSAKHKIEKAAGEDGVVRKLGIITLPIFYADIKGRMYADPDAKSSVADVEKALEDLKKQGVEGIIFDLRNNGGGYLPEAVDMTGLFISQGPVVQVADEGSSRSAVPTVLCDRDPSVVYAGPLVVLVNRFSASASEIVAGALQDYGRAVVIGDSKTHGKGTVQSVLDLSRDGNMGSIKMTKAMFYRINGGSTQLKGIVPDIVIPSLFDKMEFGEEYMPNPLPWSVTNQVSYLSVVSYMKDIVPVLKERSEKRRASDPKYAAYLKLLGNIESISKMKEVSLNLNKRRELARAEKEMASMEKELVPEEEGTEVNKEKPAAQDVVLNESLKILADLSCLQKEPPAIVLKPVVPPKKSIAEILDDWLKGEQ